MPIRAGYDNTIHSTLLGNTVFNGDAAQSARAFGPFEQSSSVNSAGKRTILHESLYKGVGIIIRASTVGYVVFP